MLSWTRAGLLAGAAGTAAVLTVPSLAAGTAATSARPSITVSSAPTISVSKAQSAASAATSASRTSHVSTSSTGASAAPSAAGGSGGGGTPTGSNTPLTNDHKTHGTGSATCGDGHVYFTPNYVWPPNHKMVTVTIWYVDNDGDGDSTSITVDSIKDNETVGGVEMNGSGQPTDQQGPDWSGAGNSGMGSDTGGGADTTQPGTNDAQTTAQVRAERSGTDMAGRTYDITVTCMDMGGSDMSEMGGTSHMADLFVHVPHDQGNNQP